jgi:hypothetical protein
MLRLGAAAQASGASLREAAQAHFAACDHVIYRLTLTHPPIYSSAVMSFEFTLPGVRG